MRKPFLLISTHPTEGLILDGSFQKLPEIQHIHQKIIFFDITHSLQVL